MDASLATDAQETAAALRTALVQAQSARPLSREWMETAGRACARSERVQQLLDDATAALATERPELLGLLDGTAGDDAQAWTDELANELDGLRQRLKATAAARWVTERGGHSPTQAFVGPVLRRLREAAGLKQADLAERLQGIAPSQVSHVETGRRRDVPLELLTRWVAGCGFELHLELVRPGPAAVRAPRTLTTCVARWSELGEDEKDLLLAAAKLGQRALEDPDGA